MVNRRHFLRTAGAVGAAGLAGCVATPRNEDAARQAGVGTATGTDDERDYDVVRVPDDHETIQDGVDAASSGDLVLVEPGTYTETVAIETPGLTLRGRDRNEVILDGEFEMQNAVEVTADGVALENLTGRHYRTNAFYWYGVEGFRGSFLTAYNDGYYGIYAYDAQDGRFEHSYASGHPDAGFYLGRNQPYDAVVTDVVAEHNAIGYSGTSAGGSLTVRDSVWRRNKVGVFPNTLDEVDAPQEDATIVDNEIYANNDAEAPALPTYHFLGIGVLVWGGSDNLVADNRVSDHDRFGVVAHPNVVEPSGNEVRNNEVDQSGIADLALGRPTGEDNEFLENDFETSLPPDIQADASEGSTEVTEVFDELERQAEEGEFPAGDWRDQPEPDDQPSMPDPEAPPRPARRDASWETTEAQTDGYRME